MPLRFRRRISRPRVASLSIAAAVLASAVFLEAGGSGAEAGLAHFGLPAHSGLPATAGLQPGRELRVLGPGSAQDPPRISVRRSDAGGMDLEFTLPAVTVRDTMIGGETFQEVGIPGGAAAGEVGSPMLPAFNRLIALPAGADAQVSCSIEDEEEIPGFHLCPAQARVGDDFSTDQARAASSFGIGRPACRNRGHDGVPIASAGAAGSMRGVRVAPLMISPIAYDSSSGTLKIARRIRLAVTFTGGAGRFEAPARITTSFDRIYRSVILNYDRLGAGDVREGSWLLILPDDPEVLSRLQPLIDWRTRQGYPVRVATTAETGATAEQIKAFIQDGYDHWSYPPEFIVLAGDVTGSYAIPTWYESISGWNGEGDHPYTQLDGPDILADAHVGRLSFNTLDELSTIVAKIVGYESDPDTADSGWFTRACLVGDPQYSGYSTVMVQQWIKTRLREIGYTRIDTIFAGNFVGQMRAALNQGDTIFCYRGIVGLSGWSNSDTYSLTNYNKLFFCVTPTCMTGNFASETSPSEAFLRAGTPAAPIAGIGAIGTATPLTHTRFNNCYTYGVFQGLLYEGDVEMGAAHTRGKIELYNNYQMADPNSVIEFTWWNNLMGDPACKVWTAVPFSMQADYPSSIAAGSNSVRVHVDVPAGGPLMDAQVCLQDESGTCTIGRTDAAGDCEVAVNAPIPGALRLTVTACNRHPILADIAVTSPQVFVGYSCSSIDDDDSGGSQGNGDGMINPGETIDLAVRLHNFGSEPAVNVAAALSTADSYVTVLEANVTYGTIPAGADADSPGPYRLAVSPATPEAHVIRFGLDATDGTDQWHSVIELPVRSADLRAVGSTLYDPEDGRLDPGETLDMSVILQNDGSVPAEETVATLRSLTPLVWVPDSSAVFGGIAVGDSAENLSDHFTVCADPSVYSGALAVLQLVTTFNGGALDTTYTSLTVGARATSDPVGPDGHGYYAFDNTDLGYPEHPAYNWIEIASNHGGDGTEVPLGDYGDYQDKTTAMDLPFTFRFYGRDFTRVSICSNGWIAMGDTYLTGYRNWSIPGAGAPENLIAPFWDDLQEVSTSGGHVYQKYDAAGHCWIVEWSRMRNAANGMAETIEALLYDPSWYPTWTGDGIILFQYSQVSNGDGVDGFATVGIQNGLHTDGLLYTYFNRYPAGASPLAPGRAIRILTAGSDPAGLTQAPPPAPFSLAPGRPNPFTRGTALGFCLPRAGAARLAIFDAAGRRVRLLMDAAAPSGPGCLAWDGRNDHGTPVPAGIYLYRLESGERSEARKVIKIE